MNPKRNNKRKIQVKKKIHNTAHGVVRPNEDKWAREAHESVVQWTKYHKLLEEQWQKADKGIVSTQPGEWDVVDRTCDVCDQVFHSPPLLYQHQVERRHWGCSECGGLFDTAMKRDYHKENRCSWDWSEEEFRSEEEEMSEYGEEIQRSGSPIITFNDDTVTFISEAEGELLHPYETQGVASSLEVQQEEQP